MTQAFSTELSSLHFSRVVRKPAKVAAFALRLVRGDEQASNELCGILVPPLLRTMMKFRSRKAGGGSRLFVDVDANTGHAFTYFKGPLPGFSPHVPLL